ncbi:hypothetical protein FHS57_005553 [Runella defluvii]|uniref:TonB-dependent receptor n=1 Tax=Runella defluvii TaxID=370973 RepID=A0A7W5ZRP3_9BACT|nr:hypothetical protein [Runella defluvii]MBB3841525.1 hypothetical protein [Runella defluvii]
MRTTLFVIMVFVFSIGHSIGQSIDLGNIKSAPKLKVSGGLNLNTLYNSYLPVPSQKLSYFVNGTLNFNVLGLISVPLSINYSNRKFNYSQPFSFNQISIAPRYKWATAYLGTSALTFSPYTLNGHQFRGVGFELSPNKWKISTMVGQLIRSTNDSTYNRMGYGLKVVYNPGNFRIGTSLLHAADNPTSVTPERLATNRIRPQKNIVLGIEGGINFPKIGQIDLEFSNSFISENSSLASDSTRTGFGGLFFKTMAPIQSKTAFKTKFSRPFWGGKTILGVGYERVDPGYRTFGGYFFTNDFENYTLNLVQRLFDNKLVFSGNVGRQRDLLVTKANGQTRFVASTNLLFVPNQKLNINFSFSNFRGFVFVRDFIKEAKRESSFIPIDTLNYTQINRNATLMLSYIIKQSETTTQQFSVMGTVLDAANKQGDFIRTGQTSQVYTAQSSYVLGFPKKKINFSAGYNFNQNKLGGQNIVAHGPTASVQQQLADDKVSLSVVSTMLMTKAAEQSSSSIFSATAMASYRITKNSNLNGNLLLMNNNAGTNSPAATGLPATIYTATIGYSYKF